MSRWTVDWDEQALNDLSGLWRIGEDRTGVTGAAHTIDRLLGQDAMGVGEPLSEGLWTIIVRPLRVVYDVVAADRHVDMLSAKLLKPDASKG